MFGLIWALTACRTKNCLAARDSAFLQCRKAKANTPNHLSGADRPFRHTIDSAKGSPVTANRLDVISGRPRLVIQARRVSLAPESLWLLRPNGHPWHPPQGPFPRFLRRIHEIRPKPARAMPNRPSVDGSGMGIIAGKPPRPRPERLRVPRWRESPQRVALVSLSRPSDRSATGVSVSKTRPWAHGQLKAIFIPREFISYLQ